MTTTPEWPEKWRPPASARWTTARVEPVRFKVRTRFLYEERDRDWGPAIMADGKARHAFSRSAMVTAANEECGAGTGFVVIDSLWRAIAAFGDDADLVIEVRRADPEEKP